MYDEPKNTPYNSCVLNYLGVHMFLCLYTVAILEYLKLLRIFYTVTTIKSCVLSQCTVHFSGAQAKDSSLDFLIMVDDSPYFLLDQKFLDSFLIVVYDSTDFVWDF